MIHLKLPKLANLQEKIRTCAAGAQQIPFSDEGDEDEGGDGHDEFGFTTVAVASADGFCCSLRQVDKMAS